MEDRFELNTLDELVKSIRQRAAGDPDKELALLEALRVNVEKSREKCVEEAKEVVQRMADRYARENPEYDPSTDSFLERLRVATEELKDKTRDLNDPWPLYVVAAGFHSGNDAEDNKDRTEVYELLIAKAHGLSVFAERLAPFVERARGLKRAVEARISGTRSESAESELSGLDRKVASTETERDLHTKPDEPQRTEQPATSESSRLPARLLVHVPEGKTSELEEVLCKVRDQGFLQITSDYINFTGSSKLYDRLSIPVVRFFIEELKNLGLLRDDSQLKELQKAIRVRGKENTNLSAHKIVDRHRNQVRKLLK